MGESGELSLPSLHMKRKANEGALRASEKRAHLDENILDDLDMEAHEARQQKLRRGGVVTQGYESDESDNDSGVPHRRAKQEAEDEENNEDDMFAEPKEESSRKEKRFLKLSDIEGQEFGTGTHMDGDDDDEGEEDNGLIHDQDPEYELEQALKSTQHEDANADAERTPPGSSGKDAQRVKKQGMGFRMESFNMKAEMESGQFDEDGNYIRNERDQFSQNDRWLEGNYSKKSIRAAHEAQRRREQAEIEREKQQDAEFPTMEHAMKQLAECLMPGESVLDALQRLGAASKRSTGETKAIAQFETLTHVSGTLMSHFGQMNIYDEVYESLVRLVRRAKLVAEDWDPSRMLNEEHEAPSAHTGSLWEYKWTPAYLGLMAKAHDQSVDPETRIFGPFSQTELMEWAQQGYFGANKENISVRKIHTHDWSTWHDAGLP